MPLCQFLDTAIHGILLLIYQIIFVFIKPQKLIYKQENRARKFKFIGVIHFVTLDTLTVDIFIVSSTVRTINSKLTLSGIINCYGF